MADYIQESEQLKKNILKYCEDENKNIEEISDQLSKLGVEFEGLSDELKYIYKVAYESNQTSIAKSIYEGIEKLNYCITALSKCDVKGLSDICTPIIKLVSDPACVITEKTKLKESSVYEDLNQIDD